MRTEGRQKTEVSEEERDWRDGFTNCQEFSRVDGSGRMEAVTAQRSEFDLYS